MSDGTNLPWPFPWFTPSPVTDVASARSVPSAGMEASQPFNTSVLEAAEALSRKFGKNLPSAISAELYLIQALSEVATRPMSGAENNTAVIYPPEFLFTFDVGLEHLVGGSIIWEALGKFGDADFPWKKPVTLRSIREKTYRGLVYPGVAGSIMIGLVDDVDFSQVRQELSDFGLQDLDGSGTFLTAACTPFEEASVCRKLESDFEYVKYAEMNNIVRVNDFSPGWSLTRLV
ncbi:hypothetical protein [Rhizobium hidalgonense]|nr:hypothetical protein [Rhizobium hidalgonense]